RGGEKGATGRLGRRHGSKANDPTGPGPHLDDNRLAEQSRRLIENDATDGVRCTAGGEWADHLDCSHRPLLRVRRCGRSHKNCERGSAAPRPDGPQWQCLRHGSPAAVVGMFSAKIGDLPEPKQSADKVAFSMRKALPMEGARGRRLAT